MQLTIPVGSDAAAREAGAAHALAPARAVAVDVAQFGLLTCVLVLLPGALLQHERHYLPKELVLSLFGFGAAVLVLARARRLRAEPADLALGAFALLGFAAAALAENPWLGWRGAGLTAAALALFWAVRALAASGERDTLVAFAVTAVGIVAAVALLEAYGFVEGLSTPNRAPGGTLGNRNRMAHVVVLGLPAVVLYLLAARNRVTGGAAALVLVLASAALVLSRSRAAWLGCGAVILFVLAAAWIGRRGGAEGRRISIRAGIAAAACAVGIAAAAGLPNRLHWESQSPALDTLRGLTDYRSGSGQGRVVQYGNTVRMIAAHPVLGVGPGNWAIEYPRWASPKDPSYDAAAPLPVYRLPQGDWLGFAAERGVAALLLLAAAGVLLALNAAREARGGDAAARLRAACLCATLLALAVIGSLDPVLMTPTAAFLVAVVLGALAAPAARHWAWSPGRGGRRAVLASVAGIGLLFTGLAAARVAAAAQYGTVATLPALERAVRMNPGDYQAQMMMADLLAGGGDCGRARPHLDAARRLYPTASYSAGVERLCR